PAPELKSPPPPAPTQVQADVPISKDDGERIQASVDALPTSDPQLDVTAGETPELALEGDSDPTRTADQRAALDESVGEGQVQGRRDGARRRGEAAVYPDTPAETLTAEIPSGGSGGGGPAAAGGGGDVDEETASIVAQEKKGDEIRAAVADQSAAMQAEQ